MAPTIEPTDPAPGSGVVVVAHHLGVVVVVVVVERGEARLAGEEREDDAADHFLRATVVGGRAAWGAG